MRWRGSSWKSRNCGGPIGPSLGGGCVCCAFAPSGRETAAALAASIIRRPLPMRLTILSRFIKTLPNPWVAAPRPRACKAVGKTGNRSPVNG
jgi:hypothetical protein